MRKLKKKGLLFCALIGVLFAALLSSVLCAAAAAGIFRGLSAADSAGTLACVISGVSIGITVFAIARIRGRQAMLTGLAICLPWVLLCILGRLLLDHDLGDYGWIARMLITAGAGSILGAVMSIAEPRGKRRHTSAR